MNLEPLGADELTGTIQQRWRERQLTIEPLNGGTPTAGTVARIRWDELAALLIVESATTDKIIGHLASTTAVHTEPTKEVSTAAGVRLIAWNEAIAVDSVKADAIVDRIDTTGATSFQQWWARQPDGVKPLAVHDQNIELKAAAEALEEPFQQAPTESLPDLLRAAQVDVQTITDATTLDRPAIVRLFRGQALLTPEQADQLATVTDLSSARLLRSNPPLDDELQLSLRSAKWRRPIDRLVRGGRTHTEARTVLGYGAMSAARTSGSRLDWDDRISRYIEAAGL